MTIINWTFSLIQGTLSLLQNRNQLCLFLIFTIYLYFWYSSFFCVDPCFCHDIFLLTKIFNISFRASELMTKCSQLSLFVKVQFSSVAQSCPTLCDPMNRSTPGLPVYHQLLEFTQTDVHWVGDAIQPSHPLLSPSLPAPNPSQHPSLFQWVNSSHEVAKVLEFQLQHHSFQWTPRTALL